MCKITDWNLDNIDKQSDRATFLQYIISLNKQLEKHDDYTIRDKIIVGMIMDYYTCVLSNLGGKINTKGIYQHCKKKRAVYVLEFMGIIKARIPCTESIVLYENMQYGLRRIYATPPTVKARFVN